MIELKAEKRIVTGKKNRKLRRQGYVPASISMQDGTTKLIKIKHNDLWPVRKSKELEIISITIEGEKKPIETVVSELIINPLTNMVENVSFSQITKDSHIKVEVPVEFVGVSPAVKNNLGVLVVSMPFIKLIVNKENIIPKIEIDISTLESVGQRILVKDVLQKLGENVKLASAKDAEQTIVTVRPLQKVVKTTVATEAEGAETAEASEGEGASSEGEASATSKEAKNE